MKPELMQSVLEISTDVCRNVAEAAGQLEDLRRRVRETAEAKGLTIGSAATHPFAQLGGPADREARALPRDRRRAAASSSARSCCSACTCTSASTTPRRRSTSPTACACTCRSCSRCRPTRRSGAGSPTGLMSIAHADLPAAAARRHPAALRRAGASTQARIEFMVEAGAVAGLHVPVVGRAPAPEPRHGRDPRPATPRPGSSTRSRSRP